ncbi:MAG TPA: hypothetical protein P5531_00020 [Bacteroidales bacterium]|nr:hypothetical protein [Bacteroidales bacterium]HSA42047.1 hypothetical protein [Bacteroidales bacterium]
MEYRVHRIEVNKSNMQEKLENLLRGLKGELVSITPYVTTFFLFYGSRVEYLLVVEKIS